MFSHSYPRSSPLSQPKSPTLPSSHPPTWYGSSGVRPFQISGSVRTDRVPEGSPSYQWRYIPSFGIVHYTGCDICMQFIHHIIDAEFSQDFQAAVMERDNHHDCHFWDGISEGRRKQKQDINEEIQICRAGYRNAEAALARSLEENLTLNTEILFLKSRLRTQALAPNDLTLPEHPSTWIGIDDISSASKECQPARSVSYAAAVSFNAASTSDSTAIPRHPHQNAVSITVNASHNAPPRLSGPVSPPTVLCPAIPQALSPLTNNCFPQTLQELHWLMRVAHKPGHEKYLEKVKVLCAQAHATPREEKTELQKVLLSKWRNPVPLGIMRAPSSRSLDVKMNPQIDDSVEIWYSYLCTHQKSWPRGVRKDSWGRPIMSDLRASRMISRLRPEVKPDPSSSNPLFSRAAFMQQVIDLFSRPGIYQQFLVECDIFIAQSVSYLPFRQRTGPITMESLVRHCAACGITVQMAKQDFEPWARSYLETPSPTPQLSANLLF